MRNLYGSPANVEDGRPDEVPGILAAHGAKEVESNKDAKESRGDQEATRVVPCVALAALALNLVGKVTDDWSCDAIGDLP